MIDERYVAGFIDGEGCIRAELRNPRLGNGVSVGHRVILIVANTHRPVLEAMQERWGGSIYRRKNPGKVLWVWHTGGPTARAVLEDVLPYLVVKKEQAETALKLIKTMRNRGRAVLTDEEIRYREELRLQLVEQKK